MRDKLMRWRMGDARLREMHAYERHASARHAYEITLWMADGMAYGMFRMN